MADGRDVRENVPGLCDKNVDSVDFSQMQVKLSNSNSVQHLEGNLVRPSLPQKGRRVTCGQAEGRPVAAGGRGPVNRAKAPSRTASPGGRAIGCRGPSAPRTSLGDLGLFRALYFAVLETLWPQYDYFKIYKFTVQYLNTKDYKIGLRWKARAEGGQGAGAAGVQAQVGRRGLSGRVRKAQVRLRGERPPRPGAIVALPRGKLGVQGPSYRPPSPHHGTAAPSLRVVLPLTAFSLPLTFLFGTRWAIRVSGRRARRAPARGPACPQAQPLPPHLCQGPGPPQGDGCKCTASGTQGDGLRAPRTLGPAQSRVARPRPVAVLVSPAPDTGASARGSGRPCGRGVTGSHSP